MVEGEIREMAPAGARHGRAALRVGQRIAQYVEPRRIGEAFAAETGFRIRRDPDTVRAPDASFVSNERLPVGGLPSGFLDFAPDLAVEVVSPGDSADAVQSKAEGWLAAGDPLGLGGIPRVQVGRRLPQRRTGAGPTGRTTRSNGLPCLRGLQPPHSRPVQLAPHAGQWPLPKDGETPTQVIVLSMAAYDNL